MNLDMSKTFTEAAWRAHMLEELEREHERLEKRMREIRKAITDGGPTWPEWRSGYGHTPGTALSVTGTTVDNVVALAVEANRRGQPVYGKFNGARYHAKPGEPLQDVADRLADALGRHRSLRT